MGNEAGVDEEFSELRDPDIDSVHAVGNAANGTRILFAKQANDRPRGLFAPDFVRDLVAKSSQKYPDVKFHFCEAADAFRRMVAPEGAGEPALDLELTLHPVVDNDVPCLEIVAKQGKVFGPQPFLAIETRSRRFLHDNLDFSTEGGRWFYAFHDDTLPLEDVARIGVAANDRNGNTSVKVLDLRGRAAS